MDDMSRSSVNPTLRKVSCIHARKIGFLKKISDLEKNSNLHTHAESCSECQQLLKKFQKDQERIQAHIAFRNPSNEVSEAICLEIEALFESMNRDRRLAEKKLEDSEQSSSSVVSFFKEMFA